MAAAAYPCFHTFIVLTFFCHFFLNVVAAAVSGLSSFALNERKRERESERNERNCEGGDIEDLPKKQSWCQNRLLMSNDMNVIIDD